jgi:hypothetical protein
VATLSPESATLIAARLVHDAINQANAEWEAGLWRQDYAKMLARQQTAASHDPLKALDQGHFGELYSMPLNTWTWLQEHGYDLADPHTRTWLAKQEKMGYLKNYPLFTKDWDTLRKPGEGDKK